MPNFQHYSAYYDLLYTDKDYKAETDYVIQKIEQFAPNTSQILELGSGSGSHANYLCQAGYNVTGVEKSAAMIALAEAKKIKNFNPVLGDISEFALQSQFDVAISLFHVISYLTDNNKLIDCFKTIHEHLNEEGVFMFDIWYTPAVYTQKPETRIKRLQNKEVEIIRIAESKMRSDENLVDVHFEVLVKDKVTNGIETITETHLMRYFSIPEIKVLADFIGFEVLQVEEFLTKNRPSEDTWGVFFVLKKR